MGKIIAVKVIRKLTSKLLTRLYMFLKHVQSGRSHMGLHDHDHMTHTHDTDTHDKYTKVPDHLFKQWSEHVE